MGATVADTSSISYVGLVIAIMFLIVLALATIWVCRRVYLWMLTRWTEKVMRILKDEGRYDR
jgi:hypothetical protein